MEARPGVMARGGRRDDLDFIWRWTERTCGWLVWGWGTIRCGTLDWDGKDQGRNRFRREIKVKRFFFFLFPLHDNCFITKIRTKEVGTSLVAQCLWIHLPTQGTQVQALVREDPTCCGATKPVCHNYWACEPQLLKPARLEPVLHNKRSHRNEKSMHRNEE